MDLPYSESPAARRPGRTWTVRISGHSDRTASVTCSSPCAMPPRSRDLAALRRFAEAHVGAHARAATVHADAACACRQTQCASHEDSQVHCMGSVLLVLRHDPAIAQVWTLMEVCAACAPLMTHTRVVGRAVPRTRTPVVPPAPTAATGAPHERARGPRRIQCPERARFQQRGRAPGTIASSLRRPWPPQPRQGRRDQGRSRG